MAKKIQNKNYEKTPSVSFYDDQEIKKEILKEIQKYKTGSKDEKSKKITLESINYYLKPLLKYKKYLEIVYVYGSAISKGESSDIDVMIIANDVEGVNDFAVDLIEKDCGMIEENARKKEGYKFHFQPVKLLSKWWHLLIEGEPWIISSLKNTHIFFDKNNLIKEIQGYIAKNLLYNREEKTEKLIQRSDNSIVKNRQVLLQSVSLLANATTEAAQILFLFNNKLILNRKRIAQELILFKNSIGQENIDTYIQIIDLEEKIEHGTLSEFTCSNLDYYAKKIKNFINAVEMIISQQNSNKEEKENK